MKSTIEELDILIKDFVAENKNYLQDNIDNMKELPEVIELFSTTGWTISEYHEYIRKNQDPLEAFIEQCMQLGIVTEEDITAVLDRMAQANV